MADATSKICHGEAALNEYPSSFYAKFNFFTPPLPHFFPYRPCSKLPTSLSIHYLFVDFLTLIFINYNKGTIFRTDCGKRNKAIFSLLKHSYFHIYKLPPSIGLQTTIFLLSYTHNNIHFHILHFSHIMTYKYVSMAFVIIILMTMLYLVDV